MTLSCSLQLAVIDRSREWDYIADIAHSGQIHNTSLKPKPEPCMPGGTISAKIQIELIILFLQIQFLHPGKQLIIVVLPLASADDLADPRHQTVNCRYGPAVFILLHVERLDLLRIVRHEYRTLIYFLRQIPFMLGLQIRAPGNLVFEILIILLQDLDRLRVRHSGELRGYYVMETVKQSLVHK